MSYEAAMSPVEVGVSSSLRIHFNEVTNDKVRICELQMLEENRNVFQTKLVVYQKTTRYYNAKFKNKTLHLGDLVLKRVFPSLKPTDTGVLGLNWEGPYRII